MKASTDISTITENNEPEINESVDAYIKEHFIPFLKRWSFLKKRNLGFKSKTKMIVSSKKGPNGPSTVSSHKDLGTLYKYNPELLDKIKRMLTIFGSQLNPYEFLDHRDEHGCSPESTKIAFLPDKACKTRIVAMADWYSQVSLSAIHNNVMQILRSNRNDLTHDQNLIPKRIQKWTSMGLPMYSSDCSAFTDRLPKALNKALVNHLYGNEVADLWMSICANREFKVQERTVQYAVGNPMGFLSSWPTSTLVHHIIVLIVMKQKGIRKGTRLHQNDYMIIGDDIIMTNKIVYDGYKLTLNALGMQISKKKCTESSQATSGEFAKRLFLRGKEVTGLPVSLLKSSSKRPELLLELHRIMIERGYKHTNAAFYIDLYIHKYLLKRDAKNILIVLSAPKELNGQPINWLGRELEIPFMSLGSPSELFNMHYKSRLFHFLKKVKDLEDHSKNGKVDFKDNEGTNIPTVHPLRTILLLKSAKYRGSGMNSTDLFDKWLLDEDRDYAFLPSINAYLRPSKDARATKATFDEVRLTYRLLQDTELLSNMESELIVNKVPDASMFQRSFIENLLFSKKL